MNLSLPFSTLLTGACEVCGAPCVRKSRNGPLPRRCPACKAKDLRPNQKKRRETQRQWRLDNYERAISAARERYKVNAEKYRGEKRKWRAELDPKTRSLRQKLWYYGITAADLDAMLAAQGGRCGVCGTTEPGGRGDWHLDHDHRFDRKDRRGHRGLLCHQCNVGLGNFRDDVELLDAAIRYLRRGQ